MTSHLLLAAVAWAVATRGGTGLRDLVVVLFLLGLATFSNRARPTPRLSLILAIITLLGWLLLAGPLRTGLTLESARLPLLVVAVVLTSLAVTPLELAQRETFLTGMLVLGCLHAVVALGELFVAAPRGLTYPARADSLLGSPNGLAMLLVATSVLAARDLDRRGGWVPALALVLQSGALLATGSRTAIAVASALLVVYAATRPGWRLRALALTNLLVGGAVVAWRFATEPIEQRPQLWQEALRRLAEQPLAGEGPAPAPFGTSAPDARVTTHAHNELLQWGVEYGLVGVALGVLVVVLAVSPTRPFARGDRWIQVAAAALLAAGLIDFTLRITALTVTAAALATLGLTGAASPSWAHNGRCMRSSDRARGRSRPPPAAESASWLQATRRYWPRLSRA